MLLVCTLRAKATLTLSVTVLLAALAEPVWAEEGLLLKQFSARYGSVTCMATDQNFRMDASELHAYLKPPYQQVDFYNMVNKTRISCAVDTMGKDVDWQALSAREKKAGTHAVVVPQGEERLQQYKLNRYVIEHRVPHQPAKARIDFWTSKDKDFPTLLETPCCKLSGLPSGYGFPLRMYQYEQRTARNGKGYAFKLKVLDTTKITRQNFPPTTFAQPQGFRPASDLMELMVASPQK